MITGMNKIITLVWFFIALAAVPASAEETEILFDGSQIRDWTTQRDRDRLSREFSVSALTAELSPPALAWRFISKGVPFNDLFLMKPISRPFQLIRVRVRNEGEPVQFSAKVRDASGAEWTVPAVNLPHGDDWRWIEFPARNGRLGHGPVMRMVNWIFHLVTSPSLRWE